MKFDPVKLQQWTGGVWSCMPSSPIYSFSFDTRKLEKNACFLAIQTEKNDGHRYIKDAKNLGASAAIVEHFVEDSDLPQLKVKNTVLAFQAIALAYRKTLPTKIIALTGSSGKTSAKEFLSVLLGENTFKSHENENNELGVPLSLTRIDGNLHKRGVLEVGISHPNEMDALVTILQPDVSILINVGPVHLEFFTDLEAIAREKMKLVNGAKQRAYVPTEWSSLSKQASTYVFTEGASYPTREIACSSQWMGNGWKLTVNGHTFSLPFRLGDRAAKTFGWMMGVALQEGVSPKDIQDRCLQWKPLCNRGAWRTVNQRHYFVDCYNANPLAFENSLQQFYCEQDHSVPICYGIGSMLELGEQSAIFHRNLARCFRIRPEDCFVCIGAFAEDIRKGLLEQGANSAQVHSFSTTEEARAWLATVPHTYFYLKGSAAYQLEKLIVE